MSKSNPATEFIAYESKFRDRQTINVKRANAPKPMRYTSQRPATDEEIRAYKRKERARAKDEKRRVEFEARDDYKDAQAVRGILEWMSVEDNPLDKLTPQEWHDLRVKLERDK